MAKSYNKRSRTPFGRKKWLLALLLVLLVAGGVAFAATRPNSSPNGSGQQPTTGSAKKSAKTSSVNLNPPTEEQNNAAHDTSSQASATNSDGKKVATPIITSYDQQEVRAFVNGVIEDGGTCTATYTHGGDVVTASSKGISDAGHTTCGPMKLVGPVNIQGDWSVTVTYSSSGYYGKSQATTFTVH